MDKAKAPFLFYALPKKNKKIKSTLQTGKGTQKQN